MDNLASTPAEPSAPPAFTEPPPPAAAPPPSPAPEPVVVVGPAVEEPDWTKRLEAKFGFGQRPLVTTEKVYLSVGRRFFEFCKAQGWPGTALPEDAPGKFLDSLNDPIKAGNMLPSLRSTINFCVREFAAPFTHLRYPDLKGTRKSMQTATAPTAEGMPPPPEEAAAVAAATNGVNGAGGTHVHVHTSPPPKPPREPKATEPAAPKPAKGRIFAGGIVLEGPFLKLSYLSDGMGQPQPAGAEVYVQTVDIGTVLRHGDLVEYIRRTILPRLRLHPSTPSVTFVVDDLDDKRKPRERRAEVVVAVITDETTAPAGTSKPADPGLMELYLQRIDREREESKQREEEHRRAAQEAQDRVYQQQQLDMARREQELQHKLAEERMKASAPPPAPPATPILDERPRKDPAAEALASLSLSLVEKLGQQPTATAPAREGMSSQELLLKMMELQQKAEDRASEREAQREQREREYRERQEARDREAREREEQRRREDKEREEARRREEREERDRREQREKEERDRRDRLEKEERDRREARDKEERDRLYAKIEAMESQGGGGLDDDVERTRKLLALVNELGGGWQRIAGAAVQNLPSIIQSFKAGVNGQPMPQLNGLPQGGYQPLPKITDGKTEQPAPTQAAPTQQPPAQQPAPTQAAPQQPAQQGEQQLPAMAPASRAALDAAEKEAEKENPDSMVLANHVIEAIGALSSTGEQVWIEARSHILQRLKEEVVEYEDIHHLMKQVWILIHLDPKAKPPREFVALAAEAVHRTFPQLSKALFGTARELEDQDRWDDEVVEGEEIPNGAAAGVVTPLRPATQPQPGGAK